MQLDINSIASLNLNHFNVHTAPKKQVINFPDFLIVGPQRTGTTWIYSNLCEHPNLVFSFPKELYFFNRVAEKSLPVSLHKESFVLSQALSSPGYGLKELIKIAYFDSFRTLGIGAHDLRWYSKFFETDFLRRTIDTVRKVQSPMRSDGLMGEATASYATLPQSMIKDIVRLNPNIKIVLMVRDPVDRAWSHAKKDLVRDAHNGKKRAPTSEDFMSFFNAEYQIACGQYSKMIKNWQHCLPESALFIGKYEDIANRPAKLVRRILDHLGASEPLPEHVTARLDRPVNPTSGSSIPPDLRNHLELLFADEQEWLRDYWQSIDSGSA